LIFLNDVCLQNGKGMKMTAAFVNLLLWTTVTSGYNMTATRQHLVNGWQAHYIHRVIAPAPGSDSPEAADSELLALASLMPSMRSLKGALLLVYQLLIAPTRDAYNRLIIYVDG
jgi:hypothetical protein